MQEVTYLEKLQQKGLVTLCNKQCSTLFLYRIGEHWTLDIHFDRSDVWERQRNKDKDKLVAYAEKCIAKLIENSFVFRV